MGLKDQACSAHCLDLAGWKFWGENVEGNTRQPCLTPGLVDVCSQASLCMLHGQIRVSGTSL